MFRRYQFISHLHSLHTQQAVWVHGLQIKVQIVCRAAFWQKVKKIRKVCVESNEPVCPSTLQGVYDNILSEIYHDFEHPLYASLYSTEEITSSLKEEQTKKIEQLLTYSGILLYFYALRVDKGIPTTALMISA